MKYNRLLTDKDREALQFRVDEMIKYCPEMMNRKISRANVQQAFVLDTVYNYIGDEDPRILCIGCFDDTAYESLLVQRYDIEGIDPEINHDLKTYYDKFSEEKEDIIFATSVLEHVHDDEEFMSYFCDLLKPNGIGILTMDFNNDYKDGDSVPDTVIRQYTKYDLEVRLMNVLSKYGCKLVDNPNWNGEPDFVHQGHLYSFATLVFKKDA